MPSCACKDREWEEFSPKSQRCLSGACTVYWGDQEMLINAVHTFICIAPISIPKMEGDGFDWPPTSWSEPNPPINGLLPGLRLGQPGDALRKSYSKFVSAKKGDSHLSDNQVCSQRCGSAPLGAMQRGGCRGRAGPTLCPAPGFINVEIWQVWGPTDTLLSEIRPREK